MISLAKNSAKNKENHDDLFAALEALGRIASDDAIAYLRALANDFHSYYNALPFLVDAAALRDARLTLLVATRQVLLNGLKLLGVSAPDIM